MTSLDSMLAVATRIADRGMWWRESSTRDNSLWTGKHPEQTNGYSVLFSRQRRCTEGGEGAGFASRIR
jgi:hypothetical protein